MARAGIYKSEVIRARDKLMALGRNPSIDAVRVELGNTGSRTTISRYLKEIEEEEGGSAGRRIAVSESVLDLVGRLSERLHEEANLRVTEAETRHAKALQQIRELLDAAKAEAESFRQQLEQTQLALAREREARAETTTALRDKTLRCTQLEQQVLDLQERIDVDRTHLQSLEQKHQNAREALEHFRQSVKEQRDQDLRQHEQQVTYLQGELRTQQETAGKKQHELLHVQREAARLATDLGTANASLHQMRTELRSLRKDHDALMAAQERLQDVERRLVEREGRMATLTEQLVQLESLNLDYQARLQQLEIELASSKASVATQEFIVERIREHVAELAGTHREDTRPGKVPDRAAGT